ncbi:MAG TPA: L-seryl-tRNA(Sec) selenium transferase [Bryobacteraceae bacterium]|nr:L-seryl-tRNA(Sec) selenium transferase [Bryobacteraceae bacterium]HOL71704.1 L-seryl-tRNA(Sec) selenium transferase [Bryobacteraceae bacterium]HOQ45405.1 L-seryl-tRNA(Sec) selenium transferase [Bryobacteraceae bacterium]HPQ16429.1 L-seryl-tRNA(Sec) selenium transferase [Bryobacteraceae bacterium]HPU73930.1 L-seryl-tRNA(Sec) selenium transferase [Bryobacteraceae bacterium]
MTNREGELRSLPSVDAVLGRLAHLAGRYPRALITDEVRRVLDEAREAIRAGRKPDPGPVEEVVERRLARLASPSLRAVINATGVVLHTNLGRAPLPRFEPLCGYSNLEYDLEEGTRGRRDVHISGLIERLLGKPGIAVNNNAAAVYLVLRELAAGGEVVVSRGELIEIGDGFRIPEIMAESGAVLREVGTTNRTRIEDYRAAINERTRLLLRVHQSNFRITGFTARPSLGELAALGKEAGIPVYEDLGSGCVADLSGYGVDEPLAAASLRAGAAVVSFSGDKLLGGPQAGIIAGEAGLIARIRRNPMYRALRLDKLILQALETTLRSLLMERWDDVPALRMIRESPEALRARAERLVARLQGVKAEIVAGESVIGGGSTPEQSLPTWVIAIAAADVPGLERALRTGDPPVIARIEDNRLLLDLRTVFPEEEPTLLSALAGAMERIRRA